MTYLVTVKKILLLNILISTIPHASMFTIMDRDGVVVVKSRMKHKNNKFLSQSATQYSLQAIYDEIHRVKNRTKFVTKTHKKAIKIREAKRVAKKSGKKYKLSKDEKQLLVEDAKHYNGGKYIWGGNTPEGFDCSGYVKYLYGKHDIDLPRTAFQQSKEGIYVKRSDLKKGDLLFFLTDKKRGMPITHVGIYLGDGSFIHAASKRKGIIISSLMYSSYSNIYVTARRVTPKIKKSQNLESL